VVSGQQNDAYKKDVKTFEDFMDAVAAGKPLEEQLKNFANPPGNEERNRFLERLKSRVTSKMVTDELSKPEIASKLQAFSDDEQRNLLAAVNGYNPTDFHKHMAKLAELSKPK